MTKTEKTVVTPPATEPKAEVAPVQIVRLTEAGKKHAFRENSQRDIWFRSLRAYEGKPVTEWLESVATKIPAQRKKEGAKTPHKSGWGFLGRFRELKLVELVAKK